VDHNEQTGRQEAYGKKAFRQILQPVAALASKGRHRSGQNDRYVYVLQVLLEEEAHFHHTVGVMSDDDGRAFFEKIPRCFED
jgi:hypothetical protein